MTTASLDLNFLDRQLEQLRRDIQYRQARLEADRRRAAEFAEKLRQLTEQRDLETLRKTGLDPDKVEVHTKEEIQLLRQDFEEFKKSPPPEGLGQRRERDRVLRQAVAIQADARTWLYPPAYACEPGSGGPDVVCYPPEAKINMKDYSSGLGGGWGCTAHGAGGLNWAGLWFLYWPPANGNLYVTPYVDIQGTVYVNAHDHWYTCTHAELRLKLWCNLYQFYWDSWTSVVVVNEHRHSSKASYWVDDTYTLPKSITVTAGTPVWIYLQADLWAYGASSHAIADGDFFSTAAKFIRVPQIWVDLVRF